MQKPIHIWHDDRNTTLIPYQARDAAPEPKPVMIICPGGAYREHAEHEGRNYAEWLNSYGVTCFVLSYRLGSQGHRYPEPFDDLVRSIKLIRNNAKIWNIDPKRVGIMGSSAGGHLASTLLTHFDEGDPSSNDPLAKQSSRPDIGVLCYPIISMAQDPHSVSRTNLLGDAPSQELVQFLSNEQHVTNRVPPCFIWHTCADQSVSVNHSLAFASALSHTKVPFEIHVYQTGRHGMGLDKDHPWSQSCIAWLKSQCFIC